MTGVPVSFANRSIAAEHSLTCTILPGDESRFSVEIVCMESIITKSGEVLFILAKICSSEVSHAMSSSLSPLCFILSARSLSCRALSSPDIYSILLLVRCSTVCRTRVDLPIPGSPPSSVSEPCTSPPPSTLFSSSSIRSILCSSDETISLRYCGFERMDSIPWAACFATGVSFLTTSSEKVFHCPHEGHLPIHFGDSCPQFVHTNTVLSFAIVELDNV